ncbi:excisionase family DNA binding protein [Streptomyces achromogenes]|uniref:helix-turn-helix domain-containing protein n=1 Tax=Streptomyces achromogenes TaxID=67255 RepID=UPI002780662A|nr:helix-turn-helix domain-containing protein [Streptomyces achromogenes]MDQ0831940.1 excisionase family DNA binding protein [Streptomyces achromogenes]
MDELTAAGAAAYLGVSREAVDRAAREGRLPALGGDGPRRFSREGVEAYHQARTREKIAALARVRETPVSVAKRVRLALHERGNGLPRSFDERLSAMPLLWRSLFSRAELAAAGVPDGGGCRWCRAVEFSRFLGTRPVEYAPAFAELFGAQPCGTCGPGLLAPYWASLRARVHPDGVAPSGAAVAPTADERARAAEWVQRRPVTPVARPVGDDDGRALVAAGLRTARARLKDAKRRGDQRHVLQMAQTIRALERDAAVVDGRAGAAVKPGRLKCGHALAANCGCPRSSARGQR